ncbi:protein BTG2-like isoform X3 [Vespula pensylvanica]|uniref:protein BTG2-like isoform X3 n=1 Tax=Vespula pensylvanica TaxID=30213 RepID=UPI001CB9FBB8|nr:protein BTG2-like isoform X3 [Vespula pensylvanica]
MRLEIVSAADFLVHLLRLQAGQLSERQLEMFKSSLTEVLRHRYRDHWFPDRPNRGSGYRCIRINGKMDPVIAQAGANVGLLPAVLHSLFPSELTMWIDPSEVSYRIGENGSICVLYERTEPDPEESATSHQHQHQQHHQHHHHQQQQQQQQQQQKYQQSRRKKKFEFPSKFERNLKYIATLYRDIVCRKGRRFSKKKKKKKMKMKMKMKRKKKKKKRRRRL